MGEFVETEFANGVGRICLNRPDKRNALKREFIEEIHEAVQGFLANRELRLLVFAAEGKAFCAGMDLGEMQERASSANGKEEWQRDSEVYCELLTAILELPVPTIAAVSGPALAGGMGLVLACDIVIASEIAFFMLPEPMRGITAAMVTPLLLHRVGAGPASYMLLSGERTTAEAALRFGLCHDVVAPEEFDLRLEKLVDAVLTGSQSALSITKKHIADCVGSELRQKLHDSIGVSARARETDDAREGLAAFLEKRKPKWQAE